ncbi:MAG: signal peptidase I [Gammaproteobacteria bacterium]
MVWDFAAVLTALVLVSGLIWGMDAWLLAPRRRAAATAQGLPPDERVPMLVDYARSFFPIFLVVLLLRSFLVEPFRIPSGSMIPTLLVGDFILVNKYTYGIRLPVLNEKIIELGAPERGDVVVFRYPLDPATPFIKRVVGLPGDHVEYRDKRLFINGEEVPREAAGTYVGTGASVQHTGAQIFDETLGGVTHEILLTPGARSLNGAFDVPAGHYFVLGDNRDNSRDSRFWGFVPDENLVGKAFFIWFSWDGGPNFGRMGESID